MIKIEIEKFCGGTIYKLKKERKIIYSCYNLIDMKIYCRNKKIEIDKIQTHCHKGRIK